MHDEEITAEAARRVMALSGLTPSQRKAARSRMEAQLRAEFAARAAAEAERVAQAEADAERARIAAVVAEGTKVGKAHVALALALAGPVDADTVKGLLAALPRDAATGSSLPSPQPFGSVAERAERQRIVEILTHPEAEGRAAVAARFAFGTRLLVDIFATAAASLPKAVAYVGPSLAERAAEAGDFGHSVSTAVAASDNGWKAAVAKANADVFGTPAPAAQEQPVDRSAELFAQVEAWRLEGRG